MKVTEVFEGILWGFEIYGTVYYQVMMQQG